MTEKVQNLCEVLNLDLGYLRGRSFLPPRPPRAKIPSFPPNILLSLPEYISNSIGKISRHDEVSAHEVSIPCLRTLYDKEHGVL